MADPTQADAGDDVSAILVDQADRLFQLHAGKDVLAGAESGVWPEPLTHLMDASVKHIVDQLLVVKI